MLGEAVRGGGIRTKRQQPAVGREAEVGYAKRAGGFGEGGQRIGLRLAEGQGDG